MTKLPGCMKSGGLTRTQIRRLAVLNRRLARAVAREWFDDQDIIRAEIDAIMEHAEPVAKGQDGEA